MPTRAPIHDSGYRRVQEQARPAAAQRGYDARWQKYRAAFLANPAHALCAHCAKEGRSVPATVVDHIVPHRGDQKLFWDEGNHQGLCKRHHDRKTATEDGGFGR